MKQTKSITIHNVMKEMRLDCDGYSIDDLEIEYYDRKKGSVQKIRSNYLTIKMNKDQERDIELEWE